MPEGALPTTRVLKYGVKGDDVYAVSRLLRQLGIREQDATRELGTKMTAQIGVYQYLENLTVTGEWGKSTHKRAAGEHHFDQYGNVLLGNVCAPLVRDLSEGHQMHGTDVDAVARALWRLGYRPPDQDRENVDFGPKMSEQTRAFQADRDLKVDGVWGQATHDQACALVGFDDYGCELLQNFAESSVAGGGTVEEVRSAIVDAAMLGRAHEPDVHYTQGPRRMEGVTENMYPPEYPKYADCSSYATWCYFAAGADDPNGCGYNGTGYTGTLVQHGRKVSSPVAGDLVFYGVPEITHVAIAVSASQVVSHGQESGPALYGVYYRSDFNQIRRYVE